MAIQKNPPPSYSAATHDGAAAADLAAHHPSTYPSSPSLLTTTTTCNAPLASSSSSIPSSPSARAAVRLYVIPVAVFVILLAAFTTTTRPYTPSAFATRRATTAPSKPDAFELESDTRAGGTKALTETPVPSTEAPPLVTAPPVRRDIVVNSPSKVRHIVRKALQMEDRKASVSGHVGADSRALNVPWPVEWETLYYTNRTQDKSNMVRLTPAFQVNQNEPAKVAMVTAWGWDSSDHRSNAVSAVAVFLKTLYCRRRGYDLYVEDTITLLKDVGVEASSNRWSTDPLRRHHQWAKPVMVAKYLPFYDWIVWQDPDVFPMDFSFDVEELTKADGPYPGSVLVGGMESEGIPLNTAHYYMRRSPEMVTFLRDAWNTSPTHWFSNDQGAFVHTLQQRSTSLKYGQTPLATMGAWVFAGLYLDVKQYKYGHPHAHLTWCPWTGCNITITHLTMTSLQLNHINGAVPSNSLFTSPRPLPTVMSGDDATAKIAVVVSSGRRGPHPHFQRVRRRWLQYCRHHGYAFEEAPLQGLWRTTKDPAARNDDRWRVIQEVLPYYEWVLYVEPDVVMDDFDNPLATLVMRSRLATDWIAPNEGKEFAFFIRRTVQSLAQVDKFFALTDFKQSKDLASPSPWDLQPESPVLLAGTPSELCSDAASIKGCETILPPSAKRHSRGTAFVLVKLPVERCSEDNNNNMKPSRLCESYLT